MCAAPCNTAAVQVEAVDESSGHTYYANTKSAYTSYAAPHEAARRCALRSAVTAGETQWEYPEELKATQVAGATTTGASPWVKGVDEDSGHPYWYNNETGESSWEQPAGWVDPEAGADTGAGGSGKLSAGVKLRWIKVLSHAKLTARKNLTAGGDAEKFSKLKKFADFGARKKAEATARRQARKDASEASDLAARAAEAEALSRTLLDFMKVPVGERSDHPTKNFEEYAADYFNLNRKGIFGKKTTVDKITAWKADVIKTSLRKMPGKDLETQATQCFRNITGYMGDRKTQKEDGGHAEKLMKNSLHAPQELRDEVYCQIMKQTNKNPNAESCLRGWQLFAVATGAFPPSAEFHDYLTSYFAEHMDDDGMIGRYARYCLGRVMKSTQLGPRREIPTSMEIDACKSMKPSVVRVFQLTGEYEVMPVTSWTTAEDLNKMMAFQLGIEKPDAFAVYELTPDMEERYLEKDERILDLVAYWQRLYEEEKQAKDKGTNVTSMYRIVYKVHVYFEPDSKDVYAEEMMYRQAVYDVVSSRYPCAEEDVLKLAAIQMQVEYGDAGFDLTRETLVRFLPTKYLDAAKTADYISRIKAEHAALAGNTNAQARSRYMAIVKAWQIYGSSFFFCEPQMSVDLPDEVFLAVNPKGILIINPDTKEIIKDYPYAEVPTWGHSGSSFVLHVGNLIKQDKLYFASEQGKEINELVRAYVNHLVATG